MRRVTAFFLLLLFSSAPLFAAEQTQGVNCTNSDAIQNKQTCDQLNIAWQVYVSASTLADHRKLATLLDAAIAQKNKSANPLDAQAVLPSLNSLLAAHETWLRWFVVADSLADTDRATLANDTWRSLLTSAHRDPYAALAQLNKQIDRDPNSKDQGLKLLLAGMITNNLNALLEASSAISPDDARQKVDAYVTANKRDFYTGELCHDTSPYSGRHYALVEKKFKPGKLAAAAAYLSTSLGQCGECEGIFDCYLSSGIGRYELFLRSYPQSQFSKEILQRAALDIRGTLSWYEARSDYLSADQNYYSPVDAAATLTRFESALKEVEPQMLVPIKALLGELYAKLNQPANARRVADWLAQYAAGSQEQLRVEAAVADMKTLELRLKRPTSHGPNIIALSWETRSNYSKLPMQLWRAQDLSFSNPRPIGSALPAGTLTTIDRDVKPDVCYWYRLATVGKDAKDLSHAAFAQTWNPDPFISSLVFDNATRSLMATGWLQNNDRSNFMMKLQPHGAFEVGRIFSPKTAYSTHGTGVFRSPRAEPYDTTSPTWWIDRGAGLIVKVSPLVSGKSGPQNPNPATAPRDVTEGVVEDSKRGLLSYSPFIAQTADGKRFYVWKENILRRQDAVEATVETIFDEPYPHASRANDFRGAYLFLSKASEVWLLGSTRRSDGSRQYILRQYGKTGKNIFNDVLLPEDLRPTFIDEFEGWLYDPDEDGIWLADYNGRPALFGLDGKLKRILDTGQPEWRSFLGHALARDSVTKNLFVANREEVLRFTQEGKVSSIWKAPKVAPDDNGQMLCPTVATRLAEINRDIEIRQCEINAIQMKTDATSCKAK